MRVRHHPMRRLAHSTLIELERTAAQLARMAGDYIVSVPANRLTVGFKPNGPGTHGNANPVSNVDRDVEARVRAALSKRFPAHAIIGEENEAPARDDAEFVWVIDPLDGTTNYLNGLPLFSASIGVLYHHAPIAGAVWCSCTHQMRPGVYHAHEDGDLCFDGHTLERRAPAAWRSLASEPGAAPRYGAFFETRVLASAALECAFVAAGMLQVAYLERPAIWDVAAGIVLARASGCRVVTRRDGAWQPLQAFSAPNARKRTATLRAWRQPVLIGERHAIDRESAVATALA